MDMSAAHVSALVLVVMVVATTGSGASEGLKKSGEHHRLVTTNRALVDLCGFTDYKQVCQESLAKANTSNPVELVKVGFKVTKLQVESALANSTAIKNAGENPETAGALEVCRQLLTIATTEIESSIDAMGRAGDLNGQILALVEDLKLSLSNALTYQESCLDSFGNNSVDAAVSMRKLLNTSLEMTSNSLAMANGASTFLATPGVADFINNLNLSALNFPGIGPLQQPQPQQQQQPQPQQPQPQPQQQQQPQPQPQPQPQQPQQPQPQQQQPQQPQPQQQQPQQQQQPRHLLSTPEDGFLPYWTDTGRRGLLEAKEVKADVVVAKDGSGKYKTINEALKGVPLDRGNKTYVIKIKEGVYEEQVKVKAELKNIVFVGDGPAKTKITNHLYKHGGVPLLNTATVVVMGEGFMAKDIGFENTAPRSKGLAIALLVRSRHSIFQHCIIGGNSHAVYAHTNPQFYRDCTIWGAGNIITGNAVAVFQNCYILIRRPNPHDAHCYVTYQSRHDKNSLSGFVFQNCTVNGSPDYKPDTKVHKSYLGHPKGKYSRVVFMESQIDGIIDPVGWAPTSKIGMDTCFFAEYHNRGPGAAQDKRLKGPGIRQLDPTTVLAYTPDKFLTGGAAWVKASGVPYVGGLMKL